jgi:OPT oligopeptide transporter protein
VQFGVASGLGLFPLTFDWAQIAYIGSPLLTPWWAAANVVGGLVIVMWIIAPIMCMEGFPMSLPRVDVKQTTKMPYSPHTFLSSLPQYLTTQEDPTMLAGS